MLASQCKTARAALGLGARELAAMAGVSPDTVYSLERGDELPPRTVATIRAALEGAGAEFTGGSRPGCGLGVHWRTSGPWPPSGGGRALEWQAVIL